MGELSISTGNSLLKTGRTASQLAEAKSKLEAGTAEAGSTFADTLKEAVNNVNQLQHDADFKIQQLATGKNKNISEVMIASEKAGIAFKLMVQVRNKLMDAYQEIMKMQV